MRGRRVRLYEGRHWRMLAGIGLMAFSAGFVILDKWLAIKVPATVVCPASLTEVLHVWLFPVLLFGAGLALFSRHAFNDVVGFGKSLAGRS